MVCKLLFCLQLAEVYPFFSCFDERFVCFLLAKKSSGVLMSTFCLQTGRNSTCTCFEGIPFLLPPGGIKKLNDVSISAFCASSWRNKKTQRYLDWCFLCLQTGGPSYGSEPPFTLHSTKYIYI